MNKKEKNEVYWKVPAWLVNLVIRMRVARWRLAERLKRWAVNEKPWRLRLYFMLFMLFGGLAYCMLLVEAMGPRHDRWSSEQDILLLREIAVDDRHQRWDSLSDKPRVQRDEVFYWHLVDSIQADTNLRRSIDSLLEVRPGLADTLREVEQRMVRRSGNTKK